MSTKHSKQIDAVIARRLILSRVINTASLWTERLLSRLSETYAQSKARPVACAVSPARMLDQAERYARTRLTQRELTFAARCKWSCDQARRLAVDFMEAEACRALGMAHAVAQSPELSKEASLLCLAEIHPAEAFMELQFENPRTARKHLQQSIAADRELEERFGHTLKVAHRLHMLTVSGAIHFQENLAREGARTLALCMRLLAGEPVRIPEEGNWDQATINILPQEMRTFFALQCVDVLYSNMAALAGDVRRDAVETFLLHVDQADWDLFRNDATPSLRDYVDLLQASLNSRSTYLLLSTTLLEGVVTRKLATAIAVDAVCCLLESGYTSRRAVDFARLVSLDVHSSMQSLPLRKRVRARLARQVPSRKTSLARQPELGSLAIGV